MFQETLAPSVYNRSLREVLGYDAIGNTPGCEWIETKLNFLCEQFNLEKFKKRSHYFEVRTYKMIEDSESILGQWEVGEEAVGFIAGYLHSRLRMLSVFADLDEKFVWIKKEGRREVFRQIVTSGV